MPYDNVIEQALLSIANTNGIAEIANDHHEVCWSCKAEFDLRKGEYINRTDGYIDWIEWVCPICGAYNRSNGVPRRNY